MRFNFIECKGFKNGINDPAALSLLMISCKQPVLSSQGDWSEAVIQQVIIDQDPAIGGIIAELVLSIEHVAAS